MTRPVIYQRGTSRLRPLLRGEVEENFQQRHQESATQLAGTSSYQVQKAPDVAHHIHGRKHQNLVGRLGNHSQGIVQSTFGQNRSERSGTLVYVTTVPSFLQKTSKTMFKKYQPRGHPI